MTHSSLRVLIADDDPDTRQWLHFALQPLGAELSDACAGTELLAELSGDEPFDIVITDVHMPMPDGMSVLAMARTAGLATPFLVITSGSNARLRAALANFNEVCLLEKPLDRQRLLAEITALLAEANPSHRPADLRRRS